MDESQKFKLEVLLEELESYRGRHTELISVLIPAGASLIQPQKQLEDEKGTATNIKSTSTRKKVLDALDKAVRTLKDMKKAPENGLAIYSGNVTGVDGRESLKVWAIEPPKKLNVKTYRCDQTFLLGPLKEMLETDAVYGLVIIERNEATIGLLDGRNIKLLKHMTSGIQGKHKTGGQSAQRFERIRESETKLFFKKIAEHMKVFFWDNKKLKGILVGGPFPTREKFLKEGQLVTQLKNKVIAAKNTGGDGMDGLQELVSRCQDVLEEQERTKQKIILDLFMEKLGKDPNKVSYGMAEVEDRLRKGAVDKLILSKTLPIEKIKSLERLAKAASTEVHLVTNETPEGVQFDNLGSVGALLRFEVYE